MIEPGTSPGERTPLPQLPPERAVRKLLLRQIKQAEGAGQRLVAGEDAEALHDFRVALRRFRSLERAHRPWVEEALPKKLRKRLRELVGGTGPARDLEVQLHWVDGQKDGLRPAERAGQQWLRRRLEDRLRQAYAKVRTALPIEFASLGALLRASLTMPSPASPQSFARVSGEQLRPLVAELREDFGAMAEDAAMVHVHAARLLVKRARYLLEPVSPALEDGKPLLRELGGLQEVLGAMHDAEVLGTSLAELAAEAGAEHYRGLIGEALGEAGEDFAALPRRRPDPRAGLTALAARLRAQMQQGRAELLARLRSGEIAAVLERLAAAAEQLAPPRAAASAGTPSAVTGR